jgi:hypothetical protein
MECRLRGTGNRELEPAATRPYRLPAVANAAFSGAGVVGWILIHLAARDPVGQRLLETVEKAS